MRYTVGDVVAAMDRLFPPETKESWDHVGLCVGDPESECALVGFAVDPCEASVAEAIERGASLLITHHPLYLRGTHSVATTSAKGAWVHRLIRHDIALFSAHTNADVAASTAALADALGVTLEGPLCEETGIGGIGALAEPITLRAFAEQAAAALPDVPAGVLVGGNLDATVSKVAICSGAGDSLLEAAQIAGADAYLTSDIRHHPATDHLWNGGCAIVNATHWASEFPLLPVMEERLVAELPGLSTYVSTIPTDPWAMAIRK